MLRKLIWAGALTAAVLNAGPAAAAYPERPIRVLVPFPAGSATDQLARLVSSEMQKKLGQPMVVENRPGAQGIIAVGTLTESAADGYTLMISANTAIAANVSLFKKLPYDPRKDFTPVAGLASNLLVLMVRKDFPADDTRGFVDYVKQRPGKLSAGFGSSSSQVSLAMLESKAGLDVLAVPYKGIPDAVTDVLGGTLDFTFVDAANALAQARGGRLKPIAITAPAPSPLTPGWVPLAQDLPGFDITAWFALVGPAGLPDAVTQALTGAAKSVLEDPAVAKRMVESGLAPDYRDPGKLAGFIDSEIDKWNELVKQAGIEPQ
ncbi:tripartite tricarboxylate transporter substrate binding protein [Orrella sp. JC864]|uniref:Bug family tripartite tricarboxylate transporter substrate binding protein n=1 Tax=Orrella sp. JC864 TaxID=3120298 RepID=UPI00300B2FA6